MTSLLRSGKFLRLFSNVTRNFDLNHGGRTNQESLLFARKEDWEIKLHRSLSTVQLPLTNINEGASQTQDLGSKPDVDQALSRVDWDIKRTGRLTKNDIAAIVQQIRELKTATASQSLLLIRCCGSLVPEEPAAERTKLVKQIWRLFEKLKVPLDISHYNALLRVYLENEHSFDPMEFLATLNSKAIEPNRVTYQRLLTAYCQKGDIDGASSILEIMKTKDLPIGQLVFNSLVMGHGNAGDMDSAKGVISVMSQAGLEPDSETYSTLLCAYAKKGLSQEIISTIAECEQKEIILGDREFLEVLHSASVTGHEALVDALLSRMSKSSGYNQDCMNIILRLVNRHKEEDAFKVLMSMKPGLPIEGRTVQIGGFFIKQLVKAKSDPEKVVSFCRKLIDSGMNTFALFRALEASNTHGNEKLSKILLKEIQTLKGDLKPSSFWPLLNSQSKVQGEKGVLDVLRQMASIQVSPNIDTISQHVLPHITGRTIDGVIKKLRDADVPGSTVAIALLLQNLDRKELSSAIDVVTNCNYRFIGPVVAKAITDAYLKTSDATHIAKLMHAMLRQIGTGGLEGDVRNQASELTGPVIQGVYTLAPKPKLAVLEPLLKALQEQKLGVSLSTVQFIREKAEEDMTESVALLLEELGSGKLTPEDLVTFAKHRDASTVDVSIRKLIIAIRDRKLEQALRYKAEVDEKKLSLSTNIKIMLMDLYAHHNELDNAMEMFTTISQTPETSISPPKLLLLASHLIKAKRTDDAFKVLESLKPSVEQSPEMTDILNSIAWRCLMLPSDEGNVELTQKIFSYLEKSGVVSANNNILGPLVNVHLVRGDVESAMKTFEQLAEVHKATPLKSKLMSKFIETEDTQRLQKLMDISIKTYGELNSLYDLVFSLLDNGRVRQAKKVLETPGLRARNNRLETACKRYVDTKRLTELENLLSITKDVYDIDRHMMYDHLLTGYIQADDVPKSVNLWTQMQEENVLPKTEFLRKLARFLKEKGQPVPFAVPSETEKDIETATQSENRTRKASTEKSKQIKAKVTSEPMSITPITTEQKELLNSTTNADPNGVESVTKAPDQVEFQKQSLLIEELVRNNNLVAATGHVLDLLKQGAHPILRIFRFYIGKIVASGDVDTIKSLEPHLNDYLKRNVMYNKSLSAAISNSTGANGSTNEIDSAAKNPDQVAFFTKQSSLIEKLVRNNDLNAATGHVLDLLKQGAHPIPRIFRFYVGQVSATGDAETIKSLEPYLSVDLKRIISYDDSLTAAMSLNPAKSKEYVNSLLNEIKNLKLEEEPKIREAQLEKLKSKFPRGGLQAVLEKNPDLLDTVEEISEEYCKHGLRRPSEVMWCYYLINKQHDKAQNAWEKIKSADNIGFRPVLRHIRKQEDVDLAKTLVDLLAPLPQLTKSTLGVAYSAWIDALRTKKMLDEAVSVTNDALGKGVKLDEINTTALTGLEAAFREAGRDFPFTSQIGNEKQRNRKQQSNNSN